MFADEAHRSQYGFGGKVNEKTVEMAQGLVLERPTKLLVTSFAQSVIPASILLSIFASRGSPPDSGDSCG
jgi:hypothetical protein